MSYYLKSHLSISHKQTFRVISQNRTYVDNFYNDRNSLFPFARQKWINQ